MGCAHCSAESGSRTYASKRAWLMPSRLPPLLTLHLKRCRRYGIRFEKSVANIALPAVLELNDFVLTPEAFKSLGAHTSKGMELQDLQASLESGDANLRYELYGICVHEGKTMASGHYVAYVNAGLSLESESWKGISDGKVWNCS